MSSLPEMAQDSLIIGTSTFYRITNTVSTQLSRPLKAPDPLTMLFPLSRCEVQAFKSPEPRISEMLLLDAVEKYFQSPGFDIQDKVRCTSLPPIYFQHRGKSFCTAAEGN